MAQANWHTFQLLTKRHGRMRSLPSRPSFRGNLAHLGPWPLPNVWLGVSAEDHHRAMTTDVAMGLSGATARLTASRCPAASCTTPTADGPGPASVRRASARGS
jgi:protein gp37